MSSRVRILGPSVGGAVVAGVDDVAGWVVGAGFGVGLAAEVTTWTVGG